MFHKFGFMLILLYKTVLRDNFLDFAFFFRCPLPQKLHVRCEDYFEASLSCLCSHLPPALRLRHAAAGRSTP